MGNKEQLQQHNANLLIASQIIRELPMAEDVKHGRYIYGRSKVTASAKKEFIEYLVSDNPNKYPNDGIQDGYYYQKLHAEYATEQGIFYNNVDSDGYPTDVKLVQKHVPNSLHRMDTAYTEMFSKLKVLEIITDKIYNNAFDTALYKVAAPFKMKLKCRSIGTKAFTRLGAYNSSDISVWISKGCTTIDASVYTGAPFSAATSKTKVYCEVLERPSQWGGYWNHYNSSEYLTVTWGVTEEAFDVL